MTLLTKPNELLVLVSPLLMCSMMSYPCPLVGMKAPTYTTTARLLTLVSGFALLSEALFSNILLLYPLLK
jgi:hypothetical protein